MGHLPEGSRVLCHLEVTAVTSSDCFADQALSNGDLVRVQREKQTSQCLGRKAVSSLGTVSPGQLFGVQSQPCYLPDLRSLVAWGGVGV